MGRDDAMDRVRSARPGDAGARVMGDLGRQVGGAYDQAVATAEQTYHDAVEAAERAYADARAAAEDAYHDAQRRADALKEHSARLYAQALERGRSYRARTARFTGDNKALALLLAGGVGFLAALAAKRR